MGFCEITPPLPGIRALACLNEGGQHTRRRRAKGDRGLLRPPLRLLALAAFVLPSPAISGRRERLAAAQPPPSLGARGRGGGCGKQPPFGVRQPMGARRGARWGHFSCGALGSIGGGFVCAEEDFKVTTFSLLNPLRGKEKGTRRKPGGMAAFGHGGSPACRGAPLQTRRGLGSGRGSWHRLSPIRLSSVPLAPPVLGTRPALPQQLPRYLRSSGAVLGFSVAPGGSQQLCCCTAGCLGAACSLPPLMPAEAALGLLGPGCLPSASYPSLPALQRTGGSFRSRTAPRLATRPKGARKRPGRCRCPVPQR